MKKQYFRMFLNGLICVFFLSGIGFSGQYQPVYAASSEDAAVDASRNSQDVFSVKNDSPAKNKSESDADAGNQKNNAFQADAPEAASEDSEDSDHTVIPDQEADGYSDDIVLPENLIQNGKLVFNFDNAELSEVIRILADLLNINYVLDKGVSGKVTIHTAGELSREDLFPVFYKLLEINGVTAVKENNIYKITPLREVSRLSIISRMSEDAPIPDGERVVIQFIPLASVSAQEMAKILTPFISQDGTIVSQNNRNIIVVVDKADNISKVLRLVKIFDTDVFERVNHRFYPLAYGDVESIIGIINQLFVSYGDAVTADINFIPITRLNMLLVVTSNPKVFDTVEGFIRQYDVPSESTEPGIYVYPVKNGRAGDIADILNKVFAGKKDAKDKNKENKASSVFKNPLGKEAKQEKTAQQAKQQTMSPDAASSLGANIPAASGTLGGEINITADESRNSLIIEAAPSDYQIIKNLLTQLDILPRQVLIEVTFAEITLDESTAMGVEWSYIKGDANLSTSLLNAKMGNSGLNVTIGSPDRWSAALSALASESKVNILSSPSVLASNSLPASIDISQEIPVASSQYEYTSGDNPVVSTDIEYRDTGIMLSVTPNINEQGLVTMDIDQEISEQASNVTVGGQSYPSFFKRKTVTTLTVQSGQTIVIGGLIRETVSDGVSGTPWFANLPVLSFLFGKTSDSISKTELIILISPYVIATPDDVDAVTQEFSDKIGSLHLNSK